MATRSMTVTKVSYWKQRKKDQPLDVGTLPDGSDLLTHIQAVIDDLKANPETDAKKETYSALDRRSTRGRTVLAVISHGTFGEHARVIDTASETIRRLTGDSRPEIHPTPYRNILNEIKSGRSEMNKAEMSCDPATCRGC